MIYVGLLRGLCARIYYRSITNELAFVNAIGESRLTSCTFVYTIKYVFQYDYDVWQWRIGRGVSEHCLRSETRGFEPQQISFSIYYIGKIKSTLGRVGKVKYWVFRAISLLSWIKTPTHTKIKKIFEPKKNNGKMWDSNHHTK